MVTLIMWLTVRRTQYDRLSKQQPGFFFFSFFSSSSYYYYYIIEHETAALFADN